MATFLTGATGYLGSYLAARLLERGEALSVLVRATTRDEASARLWRAWQLHMDFDVFSRHLRELDVVLGDLTAPDLGLEPAETARLARRIDAVLHCAAALNRTSETACLQVNLKGTLSVLRLARRAEGDHGLRRFTHVSTVSVAGERQHETVGEDEALDWGRRDYDAYSRTKKFAEHMVRELLPDVTRTIVRPSIVLGDSRSGRTTQFDMARAFSVLASLPVLPLRPDDRIDIVPADWVASAIATLHLDERPDHETYHLSAGEGSETYRAITRELARSAAGRAPLFLPRLERPFGRLAAGVARRRLLGRVRSAARLIDVFYPYLTYDTVFDNSRVVARTGPPPAFSTYSTELLRFVRRHRFTYPYVDWPGAPSPGREAPGAARGGPAPADGMARGAAR